VNRIEIADILSNQIGVVVACHLENHLHSTFDYSAGTWNPKKHKTVIEIDEEQKSAFLSYGRK
jgi:hypothetical protein